MTQYVVGSLVGDDDWALPLWFQSLQANLPVTNTGLVFVVPNMETPARELIAEHAADFAWCEILRDKHDLREPDPDHRAAADARNRMLHEAVRSGATWYLSWDPDFLVQPRVIPELTLRLAQDRGAATVWSWLNRHPPRRAKHAGRTVMFQEPVQATAMSWIQDGYAAHYPSYEFKMRAEDWWDTDVITEFLMMERNVFGKFHFGAHVDGEAVPICRSMHQRNVPRRVFGEVLGIHLNRTDAELPWERALQLADHMPLQAIRPPADDPEMAALGFYELENALVTD